MAKSTQWNPSRLNSMDREIDPETRRPITEHPNIRHTSYSEVFDILGTSGCSHGEPWWTWMVLGVCKTPYGRLVIAPYQWLNESDDGSVFVSMEPHYNHGRLTDDEVDVIMEHVEQYADYVVGNDQGKIADEVRHESARMLRAFMKNPAPENTQTHENFTPWGKEQPKE